MPEGSYVILYTTSAHVSEGSTMRRRASQAEQSGRYPAVRYDTCCWMGSFRCCTCDTPRDGAPHAGTLILRLKSMLLQTPHSKNQWLFPATTKLTTRALRCLCRLPLWRLRRGAIYVQLPAPRRKQATTAVRIADAAAGFQRPPGRKSKCRTWQRTATRCWRSQGSSSWSPSFEGS